MPTGPCPKCRKEMQVLDGQDFAVCSHCWAVFRVKAREGAGHIGFVVKEDVIEAAKRASVQREPAQQPESGRTLHRVLGVITVVVVVLAVGAAIAHFTSGPSKAKIHARLFSYCLDVDGRNCYAWADDIVEWESKYETARACHELSPVLDAPFADCLIDEDVLPPGVIRY